MEQGVSFGDYCFDTSTGQLWEGIRRAEHVLELNPVDARAPSLGSLALFDDGQVERALE